MALEILHHTSSVLAGNALDQEPLLTNRSGLAGLHRDPRDTAEVVPLVEIG